MATRISRGRPGPGRGARRAIAGGLVGLSFAWIAAASFWSPLDATELPSLRAGDCWALYGSPDAMSQGWGNGNGNGNRGNGNGNGNSGNGNGNGNAGNDNGNRNAVNCVGNFYRSDGNDNDMGWPPIRPRLRPALPE